MQKTKKVVSLLLAAILMLSCFTCLASVTAFAAEDTETAFMYGDVDGDGRVCIKDATAVQRHLAEQKGSVLTEGTDAYKAADVTGDGTIDVADVTEIQRFVAEYIDTFPVEAADTYVVAGNGGVLVTNWDGNDTEHNLMVQDGDVYKKTYTVEEAVEDIQLKVVKNGADWYGDETGNNVTFDMTAAGDFTVTFDPATETVTVTGENVYFKTEFVYNSVFAVGNGAGFWMNGASWDPAYAANEMEEESEGIYTITFEGVTAGFDRQIKFATDGTWTHSFGVDGNAPFDLETMNGQWVDAVYNGQTNITFDTEADTQTIIAKIDLTEFNFATKTGAKFMIEVIPDNYVVAGNGGVLVTNWDGNDTENNLMELDDDGLYKKTYTVEEATEDIQLKVVYNGTEWYGDETGNNVTFDMTAAGDFTVVFDPETKAITIEGENVYFKTEFVYNAVYAVGNGAGFWMNGASWDPAYAANEMEAEAEGIYTITFEGVTAGFDRQIKFATDGTWTHSFGVDGEAPFDLETMNGQWVDAVYNGQTNITFDTEADTQTIIAKIDLTEFNFATKTGAKFMIEVIPDNYVVAGNGGVLVTNWDANDTENNLMELDDDGLYKKTYTVEEATEDIQLKVVYNATDWYGDETGNNVTFDMTAAGDFTVVFDPETKAITIEGENVYFKTEFVYNAVFAVGNGAGYWMNGASWDPAYAANEMEEESEGIYTITFDNVTEGFDRQIKFATDGTWTHSFGVDGKTPFDLETMDGQWVDAVYNGQTNITFDTEAEVQSVTAKIDLRNFNFATKTGAKFMITVDYGVDEGDV